MVTLFNKGDGIRGEKITAQCRNPTKFGRIKGTSKDELQRGSLKGNVYCVIDKPIRKKK